MGDVRDHVIRKGLWGGVILAVRVFILAMAWSVGLAPLAGAASLDLSNLVLNNHEGTIQVRFGLSLPDLAPVHEAFAKGEVLILRLDARLSRKMEYLWDRQVAEAGRLAVIRKDGEMYVVEPRPPSPSAGTSQTASGNNLQAVSGDDLADVLRRAFGEITIDLGPWDILERGEAYVLTLGIELGRADVSAFVRNALFFWSFDVVPPARYRLDFTY